MTMLIFGVAIFGAGMIFGVVATVVTALSVDWMERTDTPSRHQRGGTD